MDEHSTQDLETLKRDLKTFLRRYRNNVECIERLERKLVTLEGRITGLKSPSLSGMPRGGVPVTLADLMSDKIDLEDRIESLKAKSRDLKREVCEKIDSLENSKYCEILEAHFIEGKSFEDIADDLGYTTRHVIKLYSEAITVLAVSAQ